MRVSQTNSSSIQGTETTESSKASAAKRARRGESSETSALEGSSARGDVNANISSKGRELANAKGLAQAAPDVREDKIAELKQRIASGSYRVDADKIADRLVDDHIKMSGIG